MEAIFQLNKLFFSGSDIIRAWQQIVFKLRVQNEFIFSSNVSMCKETTFYVIWCNSRNSGPAV